jgi:hypothetical protein
MIDVTDFRAVAAGDPPPGWTPGLTATAGTWLVEADEAATGRRRMRYTRTLSTARCGMFWSEVGSGDTIELVARVRIVEAAVVWAGIIVGGVLRLELRASDGTARLFHGETQLASVAVGVGAGVWYWIRLRPDAATLLGRVWTGGPEDEPGAWTPGLSGAYVGGARPAGFAGVYAETGGGGLHFDVDVVGISTAGETAPTVVPPRYAVEVTLFGDDGETPVLGAVDEDGAVTEASFSTAPDHPRPYLAMPRAFAEQAVDFQQGRASIGQMRVELLDRRRIAADQDSGLVTYHLATLAGESAVNGRRMLVEETDGTTRRTLHDGVIGGPELLADGVSFGFDPRDTNEVVRQMRLFDRTGTTAVWPRGPVVPYGRRADGSYLVPAAAPVAGVYRSRGFQLGAFAPSAPADRSRVPAHLIVTDKMRAALQLGQRDNFGVGDTLLVVNNVELWWRNVGETEWNTTVIAPDFTPSGVLFHTARGKFRPATGPELEVNYVVALLWGWLIGTPTPVHGASVEVLLVWVGAASKDWPFLWEGTHGEFRRNVYRGDFATRQNAAGQVVPYAPRIRYDEAALLADETPCRLRVTEPVKDAREFLERLDVATGSAPALDDAGRISPVRYEVPDADAVLGELNDDNTRGGRWAHPSSDAVNYVRVIYQRDYFVGAERDPLGERSAGDGMASRDVSIEAGVDASIDVLNLRLWELKTISLRAIGGAEGQSLTGDIRDEVGHQVAQLRRAQALDRLLYGGQRITDLEVLRSAHAHLRVGDWFEVAIGRLPDYRDRTRGTFRLAQVVRRTPLDFHWWSVDLLDAGAVNTPLLPPTIGAITTDAAGAVTVPIATTPTDAAARVDYAVSASEPAAGSGLWTYAGRAAAGADVVTPQLPAGADVWIRYRSERSGYRPSEWSVAPSTATPDTPRVKDVDVVVGDDGTLTLTWTPNAFAAGIRVDFGVDDPGAVPVLSEVEEFAAAAGTATLGTPLPASYMLTADVSAWSAWTGAAVAGTEGETVRVVQEDTRPLSRPWVLSGSAAHTPPATALELVAAFTGATQWISVYARRGGWPTLDGVAPSAGGVPDAGTLRGGRRKLEPGVTPALPAVTVSNGTWYVVILAEGQDSTSHTWEGSVVVAGVPGDGVDGGPITAVPGLAELERGTVAGGSQTMVLSFTPTAALKTRARWKANGGVVQTTVLAAGVSGGSRAYAITTPATVAEVELRHISADELTEGPPAYAGPVPVNGSV